MSQINNNRSIKNIVILGGGLIGWSAAVGLARGLQGQDISISLIENDVIEPSALSLTPQAFDFHRIFALQEKYLFQQGNAKLCLARKYQGLNGSTSAHYLAYDTALPVFHSIELHHVLNWLGESDYSGYSVPATAAQIGKLALPAKGDKGFQTDFSAGLNIQTQAYKIYMQGAATQLGVQGYNAAITDIVLDKKSHFVEHIKLSTGQCLNADLVIDNTGADSKVMRQLYQVEYQPNSVTALFDSRLQAQCFLPTTALPFTRHIASEQGWIELITLQDCVTVTLHYNSNLTSLKQAQSTLRKHIAGEPSFLLLPISAGTLSHYFVKNCVAIGDAAGYVGSPSIDNVVLAQRAVTKLLDLFPNKDCLPANQAEYNRRVREDYVQSLAFLQLHYYLAQSNAECASWTNQLGALSDELNQRVTLFKYSGFVAHEINPLINRQSWINLLFYGQHSGSQFDPLLNALDKSKAKQFLQLIQRQINQHLQHFPAFS